MYYGVEFIILWRQQINNVMLGVCHLRCCCLYAMTQTKATLNAVQELYSPFDIQQFNCDGFCITRLYNSTIPKTLTTLLTNA